MIVELGEQLENATGVALIDAVKTAQQPQFKHLPLLNSVTNERYVGAFLEALPTFKQAKVKPLNLTLDTLPTLMQMFALKDNMREQMSSIYFDKDYAVTTDAHRMMMIPNTFGKEGLYLINKIVKRSTKDALVFTDEYKFPDYRSVVPTYDKFISFSVDRLYNVLYHWKRVGVHTFIGNNNVTFNIDDFVFQVNGLFLLDVLKSFLWLGVGVIKLGYSAPDTALLFEQPDNWFGVSGSKALLMPIYNGYGETETMLDITKWFTNDTKIDNKFFH